MSEHSKTFLEMCLDGEAFSSEIDDFVDLWHNSDTQGSLSEFLGFTQEEYAMWVEQPDLLDRIILAHRHEIPL
jgi:hypothetical protein